jgi:hypothetical protein
MCRLNCYYILTYHVIIFISVIECMPDKLSSALSDFSSIHIEIKRREYLTFFTSLKIFYILI